MVLPFFMPCDGTSDAAVDQVTFHPDGRQRPGKRRRPCLILLPPLTASLRGAGDRMPQQAGTSLGEAEGPETETKKARPLRGTGFLHP
ncbi:hypothetical protein DESPIG_02002 [Desulfovibrio piger ATCC 29098]|uniref:Uncharacterized protein n=1 Tax=Desulfovibrio piger ATCC 29098 TaxID=411464 RepID=B6WV86_9BACT|nr:hypothetical protein DESPIG_02002 [Desulfovibrio piger ATCC 29098]